MVESMKICKFFEVGQNFVTIKKVMSRKNFELLLRHWFFLSQQRKNQTSAQVTGNSVATQFLSVTTKFVLAFDLL